MTVYILYFNTISSSDIKVLLITIFSVGILVLGGIHFQNNALYRNFISNKVMTGIGKISFSLYMWHQIVFAFSRYLLGEIKVNHAILLSALVILLSIMSYYLIENPFRNKQIIKIKPLLIILSLFFVMITGTSFYVYVIGGIIKDVPELGLTKSDLPEKLNFFDRQNNIHIQYNHNVRIMDKDFSSSDKVKILVLGNSFARDFSNILLESSFKDKIELSYSELDYFIKNKQNEKILTRFDEADFIFYSNAPTKHTFQRLKSDYKIDTNKIWIIGGKNFGNSNGIHYNRKNKLENCNEYRTLIKKEVLELNYRLKDKWGDRYIDLIGLIVNSEGKILVFTPDCKFISQDTLHLTKFGASFFANLLESKLLEILNLKVSIK